MRYLLDTHVLLWWRADDSRLPHRWDPIFGKPDDHDIVFSVASLWEIAIKRALGKLDLEIDISDFGRQLQEDHGFRLLGIEPNALDRLATLPHHHRDPFDRLLIAQAIQRRIGILSKDPAFDPYPIVRAW